MRTRTARGRRSPAALTALVAKGFAGLRATVAIFYTADFVDARTPEMPAEVLTQPVEKLKK